MPSPKKEQPLFGKLLRHFRNRAHGPREDEGKELSQEALAELVSTSHATIGNYETGISRPNNRDMVMSLIRALVQHGGIVKVEEANDLLASGEYAALTAHEVEKIFGIKEIPDIDRLLEASTNAYDKELAQFFTDAEHLRSLFRELLNAKVLPKRLLVIHGVGGVGKSSLLQMFRLQCKTQAVPVGLASAGEAKSPLNILETWVAALRADGLGCRQFSTTLQQHKTVQARVVEAIRLGGEYVNLEAALGFSLGDHAFRQPHSDALRSQLRTFLTEAEIDLLLDPVKRLTENFLSDLHAVTAEQRLVLLLDTYEHMTMFEDWLRVLVQRLPAQVLVVITGRTVPNWSREWPGWMTQAEVPELKIMGQPEMLMLIDRYYQAMHGVSPTSAQVDGIIRFARGLPMAVTSVIDLCVLHGFNVEDIEAVKPQIAADLVDRLMEGVPQGLLPVIEAAAVLRWFNRELLTTLTGIEDNRLFGEVRRFSFVRPRPEGYFVHDSIRDLIDLNLRIQAPNRYRELHQRARYHFETRIAGATSADLQRDKLEWLYHSVCADEQAGIQIFQHMTEGFVRYQLSNSLRMVLNDINTYPLVLSESRLWRDFYNTELIRLARQLLEAEREYMRIAANPRADRKLRAYALSSLGSIHIRSVFLVQPGMAERLVQEIEQSNAMLDREDPRLILNYLTLRLLYSRRSRYDVAMSNVEKALALCEERDDVYTKASVLQAMKDVWGLIGDWSRMVQSREQGLRLLPLAARTSIVYVDLLSGRGMDWARFGRYAEAETNVEEGITIHRELGAVDLSGPKRDLGYILGMQGRYAAADAAFEEAQRIYRSLYGMDDAVTRCFWGQVLVKRGELLQSRAFLQQSYELSLQRDLCEWLPEIVVALGWSYAAEYKWDLAEDYFRQCFEPRWSGRRYFECAAQCGLARINLAQHSYTDLAVWLDQAESLAQEYEYNDHLALIRLIQGQAAWPDVSTTLTLFQHALIFALRYNRFWLDELLLGRDRPSPYPMLIPFCMERGEAGRGILIALDAWWRNGTNNIATSRPETISSIPEGIPLLEAERIARQRELGDGSPQQTVLMQLDAALWSLSESPR